MIPHMPREALKVSGSNYILPSDDAERERCVLYTMSYNALDSVRDRLLAQHRLIVDQFGGDLVVAPVEAAELRRVLDSGTGTGAFWH